MAQLVTADPNSLVPQLSLLGSGFAQGQQIGANLANRQLLAQQQQQKQAQLGFQQQALAGDAKALTSLSDPQAARQIQAFLAQKSEAERNEEIRENEVLTRGALDALALPVDERRAFVARQVQKIKSEDPDRDTSRTEALLALPDDQFNQGLEVQGRQGLALSEIAKQQFGEAPGKAEDRALRERQLAVQEAAGERAASKLSSGLEKALLTAQDNVVTAQQNANEYTVLAGDFERAQAGQPAGTQLTFTETLKGVLGSQDDVTEFRRRFNKVRLSEGLKSLPPGPATDKDVQEAFKGVPKENASPEQVASFLRGAARLARFDAGYNQFKADFISKNSTAKNLNKVWRKSIESPIAKRKITIAEIYETAQNRNITPEEVAEKLGVTIDGLI